MVDLEYTYEEAMEMGDGEIKVDGDWDTMIINPDYREAFNEAEREGYSQDVCHIIAHIKVWDVEYAVHKYGEEAVREVIGDEEYDWDGMSEDEDEDTSRDQEEDPDDRDDEDQDNGRESNTLDDFSLDEVNDCE